MLSAIKRLVNTTSNDSNGGAQTTITSTSTPAPIQHQPASSTSTKNNGQTSPTTNDQQQQQRKFSTQANAFNATTNLFNNGMQMISQSLQKKFSKGVNYNSMLRYLYIFIILYSLFISISRI
jgi:hypothetical protein